MRPRHHAFLVLMGLWLTGCGPAELKLYPVSGRVTLDGKPLTKGSVAFHGDADKGNPTQHIAIGEIDSEGEYELVTIQRSGAPLGAYKVLVICQDTMLGGAKMASKAIPKSVIDEKYSSLEMTPLRVEVVAQPAPGAYDLQVSK